MTIFGVIVIALAAFMFGVAAGLLWQKPSPHELKIQNLRRELAIKRLEKEIKNYL